MRHPRNPLQVIACAVVLAAVLSPGLAPGLAQAGTGLAYLRIGAGARAIAMGNAVVSNVSDPTATYWNPGAVAFVPGNQIELMHNESFQAVRYEFLGLTHQRGRNSFGGAFHGIWTDDLDGRDELGNSTGTFGYAGLVISGNYALAVNEQIGIGVGLEYLREVIDVDQATGMAVSVGTQIRDFLPRTDIGFAVLHLGSAMKYVEEEFDIPTTIQGGVTHRIPVSALDGALQIAAEVRSVRDQDTQIVFGTEYQYLDFTSLQVGYQTQHDTQDVSFGFGLGKGRFHGQYAFSPYGENLGDQHRFSVRVGL